MDRLQEINVAEALNYAIWLRDNSAVISDFDLVECVKALGEFSVFSSRQMSAIVNGRIAHGKITKLVGKRDRTGGNLNVGTLDILRSILLNRADEGTNYDLIAEAVGKGTSQGMVSKLTGVPQGSISKNIRSVNA